MVKNSAVARKQLRSVVEPHQRIAKLCDGRQRETAVDVDVVEHLKSLQAPGIQRRKQKIVLQEGRPSLLRSTMMRLPDMARIAKQYDSEKTATQRRRTSIQSPQHQLPDIISKIWKELQSSIVALLQSAQYSGVQLRLPDMGLLAKYESEPSEGGMYCMTDNEHCALQ